ncbi:unnamed protein product, partial [Rotaria sordida]
LSEETILTYFYQIGNLFYDRLSLNEQIYMKSLPKIEATVQSNEFILLKFFFVSDS